MSISQREVRRGDEKKKGPGFGDHHRQTPASMPKVASPQRGEASKGLRCPV